MRELSLHILDVLENALEAGATQVELSIEEDLTADRLTIVVRDNGRGMDAQTAQRALDPFFTTRTTRHVGLGLPLFAAAAGRCAGDLTLESAPGQGTTVTAAFRHSHLDRIYRHRLDGRSLSGKTAPTLSGKTAPTLSGKTAPTFDLDTAAIRAELGEIPLSHPLVRDWLRDYIAAGEAELVSTHPGVAMKTERSEGEEP